MGLNRKNKKGGSLLQTKNNSTVLTSLLKNKKRQKGQKKYMYLEKEKGEKLVLHTKFFLSDSFSQTEIQLVINGPAVFQEKLE